MDHQPIRLPPSDSPYNAFEHLWRSIFPINATEKLMVMLTAYLDESGKDGRTPVFAVGGYVSSVEDWNNFQIEWEDFRTKNGIEAFHSTDLINGYGEFENWKPKRREHALRIADRIIRKNVLFGAVTLADIAECEKVLPLKSRDGKRAKYSLEYALAGCQVVNLIVKWAKNSGYTEPINFIFEDGMKGQGKGQLMDALTHGAKDEPLIGSVTFANKNLPQLSSADRLISLACKTYNCFVVDANSVHNERAELGKAKLGSVHIFDGENMPKLAELWGLDVYEKES